MRDRFRLPPMPIAGHAMMLVVGVLIVAQGATLVLTLAFPPQPPPQHSLEDIAKAMRGQSVAAENARPLMRQVTDKAPHAEGPGWLSPVGPRDRLADLLNADPSDVVLMFYVPLPAGAQPMAPQPPQGRPESKPSQAAEPRIVAAAFLPVGLGNPALIRNRQPSAQTAPFLSRSGASLQSGGFNASAGRQAWNRSRPVADRTLSGARTSPWAGDQTRLSRPTASRLSLPTTGDAGLARPNGRTGDGAALQPGGVGMGRALAAAMVARRHSSVPTYGVMTMASASTTLSPASSSPPAALAPAPDRTPPVASPKPTKTRVSVQPAAGSVDAPTSSPQPAAPPRPSASQVETANLIPAAEAAPPTPVRRGLFAPVSAGYIEGDFIAAQRVGDRWIVVKPQPEGFPTAWQSRVMLWFVLSFVLVGPLGWLFVRRLTAPLRSFADAAERLGRDPSAPATVQGGSAEITRAAAAFNLMQARLKRYVDDRTAMIGAISHDLRTPLTRMRFRLEAAPDTLKPGFERDMDQMEAMISSVLAFMRDQAEGGARERLDLRTLLDEAVKNAVAGGADVALEPGEGIEVQADPVALNRVFANLLDNAVKYGGRAVVRLDKDGAEAIATVRDFGPGLPDSELERVFKPFYRAPHAVASDASGMGLGLANSRSIILAHGGAIRLKSNDGLTAEVRLPAAA
ncbi:ATP-binding protein [Brevundimonas sp. SL130]|uniref:ATP-binding protein n=1 Tax=Brevundimonas sp. SL130 TaxID=2995143 RepID=UPI00226D1659|nr:HAMP domain-containing sensor histidine kinase [Brevundimonas sp. SL130]WAC60702.1 HAMP domain-containing sensor histidine kinase [Brevundimonas sp. SL130]